MWVAAPGDAAKSQKPGDQSDDKKRNAQVNIAAPFFYRTTEPGVLAIVYRSQVNANEFSFSMVVHSVVTNGLRCTRIRGLGN